MLRTAVTSMVAVLVMAVPQMDAHASSSLRHTYRPSPSPHVLRLDAEIGRVLKSRVVKTSAAQRKRNEEASRLRRVVSGQFDPSGQFQCLSTEAGSFLSDCELSQPMRRARKQPVGKLALGFQPFRALSRQLGKWCDWAFSQPADIDDQMFASDDRTDDEDAQGQREDRAVTRNPGGHSETLRGQDGAESIGHASLEPLEDKSYASSNAQAGVAGSGVSKVNNVRRRQKVRHGRILLDIHNGNPVAVPEVLRRDIGESSKFDIHSSEWNGASGIGGGWGERARAARLRQERDEPDTRARRGSGGPEEGSGTTLFSGTGPVGLKRRLLFDDFAVAGASQRS